MQDIQVVIAHSDPKFGRELADSLGIRFGRCKVTPLVLTGHDQEWRTTLVEHARATRAHFVIVDKALLKNDEDDHTKLRDAILPASCILLSPANTVTVASALHAIYSQVLLAPGHKPAAATKLIAPMIDRDLRRRYAQGQEVGPISVLSKVAEALNTTDAEVREVFECLFPSANNIVVEFLPQFESHTIQQDARDRSILLSVQVDDLVPAMVKIAPRHRIENETHNYPQIDGRIHDLLHARLKRFTLLWSLGAVSYSLIGTEIERVNTFTDFFRASDSVDSLTNVLNSFFGSSWDKLYRAARDIRPSVSMFVQYDTTWQGRLSQALTMVSSDNDWLTFPGVPVALPDPLHWLKRNHAGGIIGDSRQAITHGNLYGDNLLVDADHNSCWTIDFEHTGSGPILRDFTKLECDIVTRIMEVPDDNLSAVFGSAIALVNFRNPRDSFPSSLPKIKMDFVDEMSEIKAFGLLSFLRGRRHISTKYTDVREYMWGLLLDAVLLSVTLPEENPQRIKALLLASVVVSRLDTWLQGRQNMPWPPPEWLSQNLSNAPHVENCQKGAKEMDYEKGLDSMAELAKGTDWISAFDLLEARLRENLQEERDFGSSPQTKQDRARVVKELNALSSSHLGLSFTDLCMGKKPGASSALSDGGQTMMEMLHHILSEIKQGRQEDQEAASLIMESLAQNRIEQAEAAKIAADLQAWAQKIGQEGMPLTPELKTAVDALTEHSGSAYQYLQVALPIVPGILTYNVELGSQHQANLRSIWQQLKARFAKNRDGPQGKGDLGSPPASSPVINSGNAWALLVGVDHYEDKFLPDLGVCVADVTALQQSLADDYEVTSLLTDATPEHLPTRSRILGQLSVVAQAAAEGDLLLFFFSGHGIAEAGESYLLPRDAEFAALEQTAVSIRDVRKIMDKSPARAKVIVLDACHSGAAIGKDGPVMTQEFIRRVFEEAEGIVVLASCKQGQKSWPWEEKGRSVFTYYLIEALEGRADLDKKGFVTVNDVNRYVTNGVKNWAANAGVPQTPTLHSIVVGDIVLRRHPAPDAKLA